MSRQVLGRFGRVALWPGMVLIALLGARQVRRSLAPLEKGTVESPAISVLLENAAESRSAATLIVSDGEVIASAGYDRPMAAMSISKVLVGFAAGILIDDGVIDLDAPVADWLPESSDRQVGGVTFRHILEHTSGLSVERANGACPSLAAHAAATTAVSSAGTRYLYNNNAFDLLGLALSRASPNGLGELLQERVFDHIDVHVAWRRDCDGVPFGSGGAVLRPTALARLGELVLGGGLHDGRQLIPREWVELSLDYPHPTEPNLGLHWVRRPSGAVVASGWLGQQLVLVPEHGIVGVRLRTPTPDDYRSRQDAYDGVYHGFADDVVAVAQELGT